MSKDSLIEIARLNASSVLGIASNGLRIRSQLRPSLATLGSYLTTFEGAVGASFGRALPLLIEQEVAYIQNGEIIIPADKTYILYQEEYGVCRFLPGLCPYWLHIESTGTIGYEEFELSAKFYSGIERVSVRRMGSFLLRSATPYLMPRNICQILLNLDFYAALPKKARSDKVATLKFVSALQKLAKTGVSFDSYLSEQKILIANSVGVDLEVDAAGRVTLFPLVEGVPADLMRQAHMKYSDPQRVYEFTIDNQKLRVVTSTEVQHAIRVMNKHRRVSGSKRDQLLHDPVSTFSRFASLDAIDFSSFDDKAENLRAPQPVLTEGNRSSRLIYIEPTGMQDDSPAAAQFGEEQASPEPQTHNKSSDSPEAVDITMKTFQRKQNSPLPLTLEQEEALNELLEKREKSKARSNYEMLDSGDPKKPNARFVSEDNYLEGLVFEPTQSLADNVEGKPFSLQPHQKHGVAWLQYSFKTALADISRAKRQGGLLADDMGLGKTVQVLCFLAWCIESGLLRRSDEKADRPILVIAPLILLSVWQREIVKYFYAQGRILHPLVLLHGDGLKKYLNADKTLNVESLSKNRLVITNYDTVKTYIHSLKEIGWSLVVLDEAQEVKDPRTNIFRCVKLLKSLFCVAVTGTPVENGLLDLWSIMDIAQPGLLGESKEFLKRYAPNDETDDLKEKAEQLRRQLRCNTPETYILRRTKEGSLTGLPQKKQILRLIPLGQEQTQLHLELARGLAGDGTQGGHLKALQSIAKIYQHPALLYEQAITKSREEYFESCAKLQDLANLLLEIKRKKEKVLIFTRYVNMQLILQYVFENNFGHFEIINGSNNSSAQPPMRQRIIDEFEKKNGFNALILSPQVAGVGLTITGANNVVHYGRWWNPAQEAQATDRVYRLGQTKQVNVYQMISISEQFRTFDERVHMLLSQKAKIATDFLIPTSKMSITEKELLDCLISDVENQPEGEAVVFSLHDVRNLSPNQLESLVAAVWRRLKFETFLLPSQMSGAVKVLAVSRREIQMIGVNTREDCRIDDLFRDVAESSNYLQSKLSSGAIADLAFKSVLVLNYNVSQNVVESARGGLTVIRESDLKGMVSEYKTKVQDVLREESLRLSSFEELLAKLNRG